MVIFPKGLKACAVIFDFDGVIVDTEPLHYKAFQLILEPLGLGYSWEQYVNTYMGFDDRDAFKEAYSNKGLSIGHDELSNLIATKAKLFQDVIKSGITAYPGVVELINALHTAKVPLAICSGALHSDIIPILEMLDIADCFDLLITADDVSKSKPDPESYQLAFNRLSSIRAESSISPACTIAIEDTPAGIISASGAGLQVIAITNSYSKNNLTKANYITDSLNQLLSFTTC